MCKDFGIRDYRVVLYVGFGEEGLVEGRLRVEGGRIGVELIRNEVGYVN